MNLAEYLFQIEKCDGEMTESYEVCDFWSTDEQGAYYFFTHKFDFSGSFTELLCGFEFDKGEMLFADWQALQPLFHIRISNPLDFPERGPVVSEQLIVIRGTCNGQCAESIKPYYGYVTRLIPSCEPVSRLTRNGSVLLDARLDDTDFEICNLEADENVRTGTAVWSQKNADFTDMLLDATYWAYCCRCVDAVIFNLDFMPEVNRPETDGAYAAIHIKDGQLEVVRGRALEKLYHRYCRYPAMDYDIEEIISDIRGFYFRFERGWDNE